MKDSGYIKAHVLGFIGHNCSFSGDWFAGYAGKNENRNRCLEAKKHLLNQIKNLRDVVFTFNDYKDSSFENAVIYCDPPYYQAFKYRGSNFDFNHEELWEWCREMAKNNIVLVSDRYAPEDFTLLWELDHKVYASQDSTKNCKERLYLVKV